MASSICALSPSVPSHLTKTTLPLFQGNAFISISVSFPCCLLLVSFEGSKCEMSRRTFAVKGIVASGVSVSSSTLTAEPLPSSKGFERLPYKAEGYNYWTWRGHKIHYVVQGEGSPIVLIHGFGASAFHWRYNIPELAKKHKVYAIDLLGFGWSDKALIDYDAMVWRDQVVDFVTEIVKEPAVLVGNSLGGFTALVAAIGLPELVNGVALLNSAGQFGDEKRESKTSEETALQKFVLKPLKEVFQRVVLGFLFWQAKQPARILSVLKSVYINSSNVDDYLVESITRPAQDPNAGEVYYRLMTRFMMNQSKYTLNAVLSELSCPLLLLWGDLDPWVGPGKANRIKEFYPKTTLVNLQAGHCPHDEIPELVNKALLDWLTTLTPEVTLQTV
ncbi:pheophytinase, chloroplastic isoform X1 [Vigna radiata var. radiata]|uniref:Pheophytinase, chloroplastic isoform X1 n=1 Tax=Vigna radiata var. radiata TaxID=3916 RepID=A0A3Q0F7K5_VIGRR|nr:pheophytinase, chloroplastic isoform X1 [Vigna radiata var. radiata]